MVDRVVGLPRVTTFFVLVLVFAGTRFRWLVAFSYFLEFISIMTIILEHINDELYFFIKIFLGAAKAMGMAQLRFEIGYGSARVLAALRLNSHVCVRWLTVDTGGKATVLMSGDFNIKEGDGIAFLSSRVN